jgi:hypothetical protein
MASYRGVFAGGFFQQFTECNQAFHGDGRLPGSIATALGKLIQYSSGFG